jgi:two-component system CheB/CheR fusion protein
MRNRGRIGSTASQRVEGLRELPSTDELFGRIRRGYGINLESYRAEALRPQLQQRMNALGLSSVPDYLALTSRNRQEFDRLLDALLIGSTSFFRDPLSFDAVSEYFSKESCSGAVMRAWAAGCSTGEEAYSLAMLMLETVAQQGRPGQGVRVFATDVRASSLEVARRGCYSAAALQAVSPERRERFFTPDAGGYRVRKELREAVLFGQHDVLNDAPFSKLDLICCRNVLLYMNDAAQRHVFERFHFGLHPEACLFLGPAESAAAAPGLFQPHDRDHRLYRKRAIGSRSLRCT